MTSRAKKAAQLLLDNEPEYERVARIHREKTHNFFDFNNLGDKKDPTGYPKYFGDTKGEYGTWIPEGEGEYEINHEITLKGQFIKGKLHGHAIGNFEDGSTWEGEFKMGKMHGVGDVVNRKTGERKESLMRNNILMCQREELIDGKQIEFNDKSMLAVVGNRKAMATIQYHVKNWRYRVRFHNEVTPRDRDIDFSTITEFRVLHHKPLIYDLSRFGYTMDQPPVYDYYKDTYGITSRPRLGVAMGRLTPNMKQIGPTPLSPKSRDKTNYKENMFESRMVGIGAAQAQEEEAERKIQKKAQWAKLIDERRAIEEAERLQKIEEEQDKYMKEEKEKLRAKVEEEKRKEAEFEAELAGSLEEEKKKMEEKDEKEKLATEKLKEYEQIQKKENELKENEKKIAQEQQKMKQKAQFKIESNKPRKIEKLENDTDDDVSLITMVSKS